MFIKNPTVLLLSLAGIFSLGGLNAQVTTGVPVLIDVGNTNDPFVSYLVVDDQSLGNSALEYAWYYASTEEAGTTNPLTGDDLVQAVIAGTSNTPYAFHPITEGGGGVDAGVDGFQIGSQTSSIASIYDYSATNYWIYWINGGSQTQSYSPYQTYTPTNWIIAPDTSFDRILTNGSWDGWTLDPYDASTYTLTGPAPLSAAAVPEPASLPLLLISFGILFAVMRWNSLTGGSKH